MSELKVMVYKAWQRQLEKAKEYEQPLNEVDNVRYHSYLAAADALESVHAAINGSGGFSLQMLGASEDESL